MLIGKVRKSASQSSLRGRGKEVLKMYLELKYQIMSSSALAGLCVRTG